MVNNSGLSWVVANNIMIIYFVLFINTGEYGLFKNNLETMVLSRYPPIVHEGFLSHGGIPQSSSIL